MKVWLKNGDEEWILIHIEVQGKQQNVFTERMFIYFYRIRDRYQRKITAWAILTDKNKKFMPTEFKETFLGTSTTYQFNVYKVINQDEKALMAMDNPFAIVVLTVLLALKKSNKQEVELIDLKMDLVRHLIAKSISKQKIRALMNFLQHYVRFNTENTRIFEQKLEQFTGKTYPMGIEQLLLHRAETKGEKRGDDRRKSEVIRKARLKGSTLEFIADITDLSIEQVKAVLAKMGIE